MILPQAYFEPKGTSFSTLNRLKVLKRLGHHVDLLTYPLGKDVIVDGVKIFRIPNVLFVKKMKIGPSWIKLLLDFVLIPYAIWILITRKYDVIHSHEEAAFFSTLLAKIFSKYHVYDMHSSLPQQLLNFQFTQSRFIVAVFKFLEKVTINSADGIIAICSDLYERVKEIKPDANAYLIENFLDNTTDEHIPNSDPKFLRQKYNLRREKIVLYAGTFEAYQGLDLLIEAAHQIVRKYNDVHFLLVGGTPSQVSYYHNQVRDKMLSDYFTFTGSVHPNEINRYYELANILVSPRLEGTNTPLKIYAYLKSGRPVVATRHITHTQVLNDAVAILTDINPSSFAQGIIKILENDTIGRKLAHEGIKLANEKYSYSRYVEEMSSLLKALQGKHLH